MGTFLHDVLGIRGGSGSRFSMAQGNLGVGHILVVYCGVVEEGDSMDNQAFGSSALLAIIALALYAFISSGIQSGAIARCVTVDD